MQGRQYGGGMNLETGFPLYFTEVSQRLGRYDETANDAALIAARFRSAEYPRVLDICCGIGRMSAAMHRLGYQVTGIDLSPEQIAVADIQNTGPRYITCDMIDPPHDSYDLILNIYTSFGYYETEEQDLSLLSVWRQRLRPKGILIMELADMDRARNRIPPTGQLTRSSEAVTEHLNLDWETRLLTVNYVSGQNSWSCVTRLFEKEHLRQALLNSGFSKVELYGSFRFSPKTNDDNLVIIATN
jgi:SAM-dependent methyltransferase